MRYHERREGVRAQMAGAAIDALVVTNLSNVRYLTGFSGSAGVVLLGPAGLVLITDGRYEEQASQELASAGVEAELVIGRGARQLEAVDEHVRGLARVGLEAESLSWAAYERFRAGLEKFLAVGGSLVPTTGLVEELRSVKDAGEIARIERAADIADVALAQVKERLTDGPTEAEFAAELEYEMRRRGADDVSFPTIVGSGPNGARPHCQPGARHVEAGDVVVVDFGALVDGYHSDMTRIFAVGGVESRELADLIESVAAAQRAGVRAARPGVSGAEIDRACRSSLERDGYAELFTHPTGHGVGLDIHEAPAAAADSADILTEGVVVTVEPGAYLPGRGGVRIEDTLVVTADGARPVTKSTKDVIL